jgi:hypothetical protein
VQGWFTPPKEFIWLASHRFLKRYYMEINKEQVDELKSCLEFAEMHLHDGRVSEAIDCIQSAQEIIETLG